MWLVSQRVTSTNMFLATRCVHTAFQCCFTAIAIEFPNTIWTNSECAHSVLRRTVAFWTCMSVISIMVCVESFQYWGQCSAQPALGVLIGFERPAVDNQSSQPQPPSLPCLAMLALRRSKHRECAVNAEFPFLSNAATMCEAAKLGFE